jgi:hypothetical protein
MNILLGVFNAIIKATAGNESLHEISEISNDNGVSVVNFATSKKSDSQKYNLSTS